jgi:hypothetical protein
VWCAAAFFALLLVSGCTELAMETEFRPVEGPDPSYHQLVADQMKKAFKDYPSYTAFEVSEARWVHTTKGWGWLSCVRFQDQGHQRSYAIMIKDKAVIDSHFAVVTDSCDAVAYAPLEIPTGSVPLAGIGRLSPLY